jgi:hypothetical protein
VFTDKSRSLVEAATRMRSTLVAVASLWLATACGGMPGITPASAGSTTHVVTVSVSGSGAVRSTPAGIDCGQKCTATLPDGASLTLTATPAAGATFSGWSGACSGSGACTLSLKGDASVRANFTSGPALPPPVDQRTLTVSITGPGSVISRPAGIDCGTTCSAIFASGTALTLAAVPGNGARFKGWDGACSGTGDCAMLLSANTTVSAGFDPPPPPPPPPLADECTGLTPASLPQSVAVPVVSSPQGPCVGGVSDDGDGTFMLGYWAGNGPLFHSFSFFRIEDGAAVQVGKDFLGSDEAGEHVFSQPSGFTLFSLSGVSTGSSLSTWTHDGVFVAATPLAPANLDHPSSSAVGIDPSGGMAAVRTYFTADRGWITTYQRFDRTGAAKTGEVLLDTGEHRVGAVGVALSGHALVLLSHGNPNWQARWVARDGTPISDTFDLQGPELPGFQFLLDGSLALGFGDPLLANPTFTSRIEDGSTSVGPLPGWLQQRASNLVYAVRSGMAYATWGGGGQCGSDLEVVATSGKSCGCLKVPNLGHLASIGRDSSLIVPGQSQLGCTYDLYPKLLR